MLHVLARRFAPLAVCLALAAPAAAQHTRVTAALGGIPPDGPNGAGVLSADGRYAAFESEASNLVTGDTNLSTDVFVRDLLTATTTRVSLHQDGQERAGNSGMVVDIGNDGQLDISDDGRYVVFMSRAPLANGDAAACEYLGETLNCPDIYLRDRIAGSTTRVSLAPGGGQPDGASHDPRMSGDGRWIVFESEAANLVPGDTNGVTDVFLFDRVSGAISRISAARALSRSAELRAGRQRRRQHHRVRLGVRPAQRRSRYGVLPERAAGLPAALRRRPAGRDDAPGPGAADRHQPCRRHAGRAPDDHVSRRGGQVLVAPDGASVAVNASSIASEITNSTGYSSESWIYDRELGRVMQHDSGAALRELGRPPLQLQPVRRGRR